MAAVFSSKVGQGSFTYEVITTNLILLKQSA